MQIFNLWAAGEYLGTVVAKDLHSACLRLASLSYNFSMLYERGWLDMDYGWVPDTFNDDTIYNSTFPEQRDYREITTQLEP